VDLLTTFGTSEAHQTLIVRYILVEASIFYNVLIGRQTLNKLGAIVSTPHMTMKFLVEDGMIITMKADPKATWECYARASRSTPI